MRGQTLVVGFGVTGANAASHLLYNGTDPADLIVVDTDTQAVEQATARGIRAILGDGTQRHVFAQAVSALGHALHEYDAAVTHPWTVVQRPVRQSEIGRPLHDCVPTAVALVRSDQRHWDPHAAQLRLTANDGIALLRTRTEK